MTSQSGVRYLDQINGRKVVRGSVHNINGQRVRFHAIRKFDALYWTADCGWTFGKNKLVALTEARTLDVVEG